MTPYTINKMDISIELTEENSFNSFCLNYLAPIYAHHKAFHFFTYDVSTQTEGDQLLNKRARDTPNCCNCKKSRCLKFYCECFANRTFCVGCNCVNCYNRPEKLKFRERALSKVLQKNPEAFEEGPKKGCSCKKSGCQKKYCECFQKGKSCSGDCKCSGCANE